MMTAMNPNETNKSWKASKRQEAVQLYLSGAAGDVAGLIGVRVAGFPLALNLVDDADWIDPEELGSAAAGLVQVDRDNPASVKRFQKLAAATKTPLIAAAYDPPLAFVRSLIRTGAQDVIPLPLEMSDLESALAPIAERLARSEQLERAQHGRHQGLVR